MKSTYELTVRGYELDSFGHVNNAVYLQYAEAAKWDFFYSAGLLGYISADGFFPVLLENNIRYMHELRLMNKVRIDTEWSCSGKILHYKQMFYNETAGVTACRVTGKLMFVDSEKMLCDIPPRLLEYMEANEIEDRHT